MATFVSKNNVINLRKSVKVFEASINDYDATYSLVKKVLKVIGLRVTLKDTKFASFCWDAYFWFACINVVLAAVLETINMLQTAAGGNFLDLFTMMPCVGYLIVALAKASKIKMYRSVFENLVYELRDMWPVEAIPEEEDHVVSVGLRRLKFLVRAYFSCNMILGSIFIVPVVYVYIKWLFGCDVSLILPFGYWLPFDPFQGEKYLFLTVLMVMACHCFLSALFMMAGDLLLIIFLSHITTQFALLAVRINKLFYVPIDDQLLDAYPLGEISKKLELLEDRNVDPTSQDYEDAVKRIESELILIIQRHRALIRLSGDIENMYTFSLLVNFMNSSVIICFCLFCVAFVEKWNECLYKIFFVTAISQTGILCWYGQRLMDTSTGVGEALYNCGWYIAPHKIKKSILIMIHRSADKVAPFPPVVPVHEHPTVARCFVQPYLKERNNPHHTTPPQKCDILRSQKEVHITTYGFSVISLQSYATILKTSWSYFTLLINMYKEKKQTID